jgi:hypothetical protein
MKVALRYSVINCSATPSFLQFVGLNVSHPESESETDGHSLEEAVDIQEVVDDVVSVVTDICSRRISKTAVRIVSHLLPI